MARASASLKAKLEPAGWGGISLAPWRFYARPGLACGLALCVFASAATAAEPYEVVAQSLEYEHDRRLYSAEGDVRIVQGSRSIDADWAILSLETRVGIASGNVVYVDGDDRVTADFIHFDTENLKGVVFNATVDMGEGQLRVVARELVKKGEDAYAFRSGTFTTCRCPEGARDPWRVRASEAELQLGGYGTVKNTTFEVLGVPVLWLPWMIYPVKTERESGLLFPLIGASDRNGFGIGLPLFWAARENINLIATPIYLTKRGLKANLDVEYVFGQRSAGALFGSYLKDQRVPQNASGPKFSDNRWAAIWEHDQFLPLDWRFRADVKLVSDNEYNDDFNDLRGYRADRFLESTIFAFRHFGPDGVVGTVGSAFYADDQQGPDDDEIDGAVLQRFPAIAMELLPTRIQRAAGLVPSMDLEYIRFDTLADPPFVDPDDPMQTVPVDRGNRLVLHPRLARPFRIADRFEVYPQVGWYETLYFGGDQDFAARGLFTSRVDLRTRLQRRFDFLGGRGMTHVLEPRLAWAFVSEASQSGNPMFVPATSLDEAPQLRLRQLELGNLVRDPSDHIRSTNTLSFVLSNRIYASGAGGATPLLADISIGGDYDFENEESRIVIDGRTFPFKRIRSRFLLTVDPVGGHIDEGLA